MIRRWRWMLYRLGCKLRLLLTTSKLTQAEKSSLPDNLKSLFAHGYLSERELAECFRKRHVA